MQNKKNEEDLFHTIESLRKDMILAGMQEGFTSRKTLELSQRLDHYIAKYQKLKTKIEHVL